MFRKQLVLIAIVCTFWTCNLQAVQINSTWVGGQWGFWDEASNWDPAVVPDNDGDVFVVTIDSNTTPSNRVDVELSSSVYIDQLNCYGNVVLSGEDRCEIVLVEPNGLTNHGDLDLGVEVVGNVYNDEGASIFIEEHSIEVEGDRIQNDGRITIVGGGSFGEGIKVFHNSEKIELYHGECFGGILNNSSSGVIEGFGSFIVDANFVNDGVVSASHGDLQVFVGGSFANTGLLANGVGGILHLGKAIEDSTPDANNANNLGVIEANAGGAIVFHRKLFNEPNGIIKLLGGTLAAEKITQKPGATLQGFGGITGDVIIDPDGIIKLTGPTNIVGDVEIKNDATLEVSDGLTLITGKTTCNGTIYMKGGYLIPQGGLSGNCNIIWEPGTYTNVADFNLDGQVNLKDFALFADTWLWESAWR